MIAPIDTKPLVCKPELAIAVLVELVQSQREEIARLRHDLADAIALAKEVAVEAYYVEAK